MEYDVLQIQCGPTISREESVLIAMCELAVALNEQKITPRQIVHKEVTTGQLLPNPRETDGKFVCWISVLYWKP